MKSRKYLKIKKSENQKQLSEKRVIVQKVAVSTLAAIFLLLLYAAIFSFSEQDAEQSGSLSARVTELIVEQVARFANGWTESYRESLIAYWEHPVRKLAHFTEYAVLGILVWILWRPWKKKSFRLFSFVVLWVAVSAAADEFHQLFVPGRCGSPGDVFLDTLGGIFGLLLCLGAEKIGLKFKYKSSNPFP